MTSSNGDLRLSPRFGGQKRPEPTRGDTKPEIPWCEWDFPPKPGHNDQAVIRSPFPALDTGSTQSQRWDSTRLRHVAYLVLVCALVVLFGAATFLTVYTAGEVMGLWL